MVWVLPAVGKKVQRVVSVSQELTYSNWTPSRLYCETNSVTVLTNAVRFSAVARLEENQMLPVQPPIAIWASTPYAWVRH